MIDFPANPTIGDQFTDAGTGITWTWDGVKWTMVAGQDCLPLVGGTLTGPLFLAADPTIGLGAATKDYVDANVGGIVSGLNLNRLLNGDMSIDQRNNGAVAPAVITSYTLDRWFVSSGNTLFSVQRIASNAVPAGGATAPLEFPNCLMYFQSGTPSGGIYNSYIAQPIEADMMSDFAWGTPNAQPVTLTFWVWSNAVGGKVLSGGIRSGPVNTNVRYYMFLFTPVINTWTKFTVTIPGDTSNVPPWALSGNGFGAMVYFNIGANLLSLVPNVWGATSGIAGAFAPAGAVSLVANERFAITGVKLEVGNKATPFVRDTVPRKLADCQRYYQSLQGLTCFGPVNLPTATLVYNSTVLPVTMRAIPTQVYSQGVANVAAGASGPAATGAISTSAIVSQATTTAATGAPTRSNFNVTLNAEL
jgi:hypothetical protein